MRQPTRSTRRSSTRGPAPQALPLLMMQGVEEETIGGESSLHLRTWGEAWLLLRHYSGASGSGGGNGSADADDATVATDTTIANSEHQGGLAKNPKKAAQ